jgi:sugar/nucleoside kinase (ribokinase family)
MKKIAVIGPIPRDHIVTHQGDLIQKWGCVTHPVIALSILAGDSIEIIPVSHVRKVDRDNVQSVFKGYKGINLNHITSKSDQGDIISLRFVDMNNRLERQTGFMDPILPADVDPVIDSNVFVFIPISDYEISLDTLRHIKKVNKKSVIIFDAHGPTTACLYNGERKLKFWIDRDQWLPYIDVLKMNLEEAQASWFKKEYESQDFTTHEILLSEMSSFANYCINKGVKCVAITMDSRGCMVFFSENGKVREEMVPAVSVDQVIDTTGCGDSFAGGVGFGLLQNPKDYIQAVRYGNTLGALRTQGKTFSVFKSLEETDRIILETYHLNSIKKPDVPKINELNA